MTDIETSASRLQRTTVDSRDGFSHRLYRMLGKYIHEMAAIWFARGQAAILSVSFSSDLSFDEFTESIYILLVMRER